MPSGHGKARSKLRSAALFLFTLARGVFPADQARPLTAGLLDPDMLLLRREAPFDASLFPSPRDVPKPSRFRIESGLEMLPTYERRGKASARVSSGAFGGRLWYAPNSAVVFALGGESRSWEHAYSDKEYSLQWGDSRRSLPLAAYYRGRFGNGRSANGPFAHAPFDFALMGEVTDGDRESWRAALELKGRGDSTWRIELRISRYRFGEDVSFYGKNEDGMEDTSLSWQARYAGHGREIGFHARQRFGIGMLSAKAAYHDSRPRVGIDEYQLMDSSQALHLGVLWGLPVRGSWNARWEYSESQSYSTGLRLPPGSSGIKRFHHALGHAYSGLGGLEWKTGEARDRATREPRTSPASRASWSFGLYHRFYRYRNSPDAHAFSDRKETLSYNRLESSFLATLYGGFQQSGELASAFIDMQSAEVRPAAEFYVGNGFSLGVSMPAALADLDIRFAGETVTKTPFSSAMERTYAWEMRGPVLVITPGTTLNYANGAMALSVRGGHSIPVWEDLRTTSKEAGGGPGGGASEPWLGNGLSFAAAASLDF